MGTGTAWVYERLDSGQWIQSEKLLGSKHFFFDQFGFDVEIEGDTIVVGAPQFGARFPTDGAVDVFERNTGGFNNWGEAQIIRAEPSLDGNYFGYSISLDGDQLMVGAVGDRSDIVSGGAAFIFERSSGQPDSWMQVADLRPQTVQLNLQFGEEVAIDRDTAMVGTWRDRDERGQIDLFAHNAGGPNAWGRIGVITDPESEPGDGFGYSIALDGNVAAVGSWLDDDAFGTVTIHERTERRRREPVGDRAAAHGRSSL